MQRPLRLPPLDSVAQAHSDQLKNQIIQHIQKNSGRIPFSTFMQNALYAPGLGYYVSGAQKIGAQGDFVTAPEISPLFSYAIGHDVIARFQRLQVANILELGAGSGKMAYDLLCYLQHKNHLPDAYFILEISPDLRQRQKELLQTLDPFIFSKIHWLEQLPDEFSGFIIANEVLDAMPVCRFEKATTAFLESFVAWDNDHFIEIFDAPQTLGLTDYLSQLEKQLETPFAVGYRSEVNLNLAPWLRALSHTLKKGGIVLIDYGFAAHEYYHADRNMGSLMCHFQHHSHSDPFLQVGMQDITAHVNFSEVIAVAEKEGLLIAEWQPQAYFLLNAGLMDLLNDPWITTNISYETMTAQIKKLTLPHEMGELFKVVVVER